MKSVTRSARNKVSKFQNTADDPIILDSQENEKNLQSGKTEVDKRVKKNKYDRAESSKSKKNKNDRAGSSKSTTKRKRSHSGLGVKKLIRKKRRVSVKNTWFGIRTRSTPRQLYLCISKLKKKQREAVTKMGFGKMLTFDVDGIPAKLGHYVVDNFDVNKMEIKVASGKIKVDAESVHYLLGIPCNGIKVDSLTKTRKLHPTVKSWRERYPIRGYVSPSQIVKKINDGDDDDGFNFKLDFLMLFLTTMVNCLTHGKCKEDILHYLTGDTDFSKINWCSYVVDSMRDCKKLWRRCDLKSPFTGPLCILTLLYVDSIECTGMKINRGVKPIEFWTKDRLKEREDWEIKNGGFGVGKITRLSGQMIGLNEVPETDGCKEISKVEKLFEVLLKNKKRFEKMFELIYKKHPTNNQVLSMKMRYENMMQDNHQWNILEDSDKCDEEASDNEMDVEPPTNDNVVEKNLDGEREKIDEAGFHDEFMLMKQETSLVAAESDKGQDDHLMEMEKNNGDLNECGVEMMNKTIIKEEDDIWEY